MLYPIELRAPTQVFFEALSCEFGFAEHRVCDLLGFRGLIAVLQLPNAGTSSTGRLPQANSDEREAFALGGATGFEPATPRTTTWCANQLRHAPHRSLHAREDSNLRPTA